MLLSTGPIAAARRHRDLEARHDRQVQRLQPVAETGAHHRRGAALHHHADRCLGARRRRLAGLGGSVTAGILSARGRDIGSGPYDDFLQIDAPINPGNSGGPLFDRSGKVIGVPTAIYSPNGGSVGIGFAIPAATATKVIAALRDHGSVERGWLGLQMQPMTDELAQSMGLSKADGVLINRIEPD